jgi:hypothetical protein
MLKSYEAIYHHGQLYWVDDKPDIKHAEVIVTVIDKTTAQKKFSPDEIHLLLNEARSTWGKDGKLEDINKEIAAARAEWQREWDM